MKLFDLFINDIKRLKRDFSFLLQFDYEFGHELKHNISPSIVYENKNYKILIGYTYEDDRFFILKYDLSKNNCYSNGNTTYLLCGVNILGKSYKEQVGQVQEFLKNYLKNS